MSGGAWEYTAAYVNNGHSNLTSYGSTLVNAAEKYKDVYSKESSDSNERNYQMSTPDRGHYGDAIWETSSRTGGNWTDSWYSDYSYFPCSSGPFFHRGGGNGSASSAGVFNFSSYDGSTFAYYGFRVVVPVF